MFFKKIVASFTSFAKMFFLAFRQGSKNQMADLKSFDLFLLVFILNAINFFSTQIFLQFCFSE